jgi:hypothetical protein
MFLPDRDPHGPNRGLPQARAVEVVVVASLFSCPTEEPPPGAGAGAAQEQQLLPRARRRGGGGSSGGRAGAAGPSASSSAHSPRCVAPVLLVKVRRRCGRGKGMSGGRHPREEIRLQVRPASFILSTAPAHPSGRVTRVGRLRPSVSVGTLPTRPTRKNFQLKKSASASSIRRGRRGCTARRRRQAQVSERRASPAAPSRSTPSDIIWRVVY